MLFSFLNVYNLFLFLVFSWKLAIAATTLKVNVMWPIFTFPRGSQIPTVLELWIWVRLTSWLLSVFLPPMSGLVYVCWLVLPEPPAIHPQPSELDVILNNPILLPCEATGTPSPFITWQKEGINVITSGTYHGFYQENQCLLIQKSASFFFLMKIKILLSPLSLLWCRQWPRSPPWWRLADLQSLERGCRLLHVCGSESSWYSLGQNQVKCSRYLHRGSVCLHCKAAVTMNNKIHRCLT